MNNKQLKDQNNNSSDGEKRINFGVYQSAQTSYEEFDQPVILRQSPIWGRVITWSLIAVTVSTVGWASVAKIEQVVPAVGQLKPIAKVKEVQAPVNGVIADVFVEDGDRVEKGEPLMRFDTRATEAELKSLQNVRQSLLQENNFYRTIMRQSLQTNAIETEIIRLDIPQQVAYLARNRAEIISENQFLQALLQSGTTASLSPQQLARLQITKQESNSRINADELEIDKLAKQLSQNKLQRENAQARLTTETQILGKIKPLAEQGAIAQLQYTRQIQEVDNITSELNQLREEEQRLNLDIIQKQNTLRSTTAIYERDTRNQLAINQQRIAEIDSQLTKIIVENEKQISELDKQMKQMDVTLEFQEVIAPISGTVFDLKASRGFVPSPSQAEPLLKIVPDDNLIAEVFVTNKDIGFIRPEMNADIRIDSYPFSEFGAIDGKVSFVGSDALPPDQINQYYRFPVKVQLDKQYLELNERQIPLQSGMSISVNIKVREDRTVLSLLTEKFTTNVDKLKSIR
jgi:hemolysin D